MMIHSLKYNTEQLINTNHRGHTQNYSRKKEKNEFHSQSFETQLSRIFFKKLLHAILELIAS